MIVLGYIVLVFCMLICINSLLAVLCIHSTRYSKYHTFFGDLTEKSLLPLGVLIVLWVIVSFFQRVV